MDKPLLELQSYLEELEEIAELLYMVKINMGLKKLSQIMEPLSIALNKMEEFWTEEDTARINGILKLVVQCLENKDYILLADVIKYELLHTIKYAR